MFDVLAAVTGTIVLFLLAVVVWAFISAVFGALVAFLVVYAVKGLTGTVLPFWPTLAALVAVSTVFGNRPTVSRKG